MYQKVQTTPNQVYTAPGVTPQQTVELTAMVDEDNAGGCDEFFWSAPIDNADETKRLSQKTSWRVKGRYLPEPLNELARYDVPSTSGTKTSLGDPSQTTSETSSTKNDNYAPASKKKANIHRNPKQVADRKHQRNLRYKKNFSEKKTVLEIEKSSFCKD